MERTASHAGAASQRVWVEDQDLIGLAGEWAFWTFMRRRGVILPEPRSDLVDGDGGIDFVLPNGATVDAKTASDTERNPLWVNPESRRWADVYVYAQYRGDDPAVCVGWASQAEVRAAPVEVTPMGPIRHSVRDLRPMATFWVAELDEGAF